MFVEHFLSTKKIFHDFLERGIRDWKISNSSLKNCRHRHRKLLYSSSNNIYLSSCEESNRLYNTILRYTITRIIMLLLYALPVLLLVLPKGNDCLSFDDPMMNRRSIFSSSAATAATVIAASGGAMTGWLIPATDNNNAQALVQQKNLPSDRNTDSLLAYQVFPDATPKKNPTIKSVTEDRLIKSLSKKRGALWLGEHHNAERDHILQVDMIRKLHASKMKDISNSNSNSKSDQQQQQEKLGIGLEQIQIQFQPVLDAYIAGNISTEEMKKNVEWDRRWQWPFEGYRDVFEVARELQIPLIALNVDSEDLKMVEAGGFSNLSPEKRSKYIKNPEMFANFAKPGKFKCYVEYVILPSFDMHKKLGLLQYTMSGEKLDVEMDFKRFFSGRILWDEAMASRAFTWTEQNPDGLLIGLVGADHVKYRSGIPGRYDGMVNGTRDCISMMLNPSLIDTRPPGSISMEQNTNDPNQLTLQLIYTKDGVDATTDARFLPENIGGVLPLADYIITSKNII